MQDWQALELGNFRKKNISFNLKEVLIGLEKFFHEKAKSSRVKIIMHTNYDLEIKFSDKVSV